MIRRRFCILSTVSCAVCPAAVSDAGLLEVWRDPNCGCCSGWVKHARTAGFTVRDNLSSNLAPVRRMLGTPEDLFSSHGGRIDGYVLEGHVPAMAIQRLLDKRPTHIRGLAVPEMPIGSPGMEVPGEPEETYEVIGFGSDRTRVVFMRFRGAQAL